MNEKKNCAIVLAANKNMTFALANTLIGIKKHSPALADDIFVYEQGISINDKRLINNIIPTKFIEYSFKIDSKENKEMLERYSELTFARYECFDLLKYYKNVIWLDIDILIQKDIDKMLNFANVTGFSVLYGGDIMHSLKSPIEGYNMKAKNCNAGILALNEKLPQHEKLTKWCYEETLKQIKYLNAPDQGIICLMFEKFNIEVFRLNLRYNYHPIDDNSAQAVILHSMDQKNSGTFLIIKNGTKTMPNGLKWEALQAK